MSFESKAKYVAEFIGIQNMIVMVGGLPGIIIGIIGLLIPYPAYCSTGEPGFASRLFSPR